MRKKFNKNEKSVLSIPIEIKSIDKNLFTLTMIASTQDTDRHGDVIIQSGWILDQFNENPVILNSHNYSDVTEVIAKATRTEIVGKGKKSRLEQDWKFAVNENPKAKIIFDLYAGGFLTASSVGFIPRKFKENPDGTKDWWTIEEAELLEVSAVSVPANARALAKSKGIDIEKLGYGEDGGDKDDEEIRADKEIASDNGESDTDDSDDSKGGSEDNSGTKHELVDDATEENNDEISEDSQEFGSDKEEKQENSYTMKVALAIKSMQQKKIESYKKTISIIQSLIDSCDGSTQKNSHETNLNARKVNKAIRELLKTK